MHLCDNFNKNKIEDQYLNSFKLRKISLNFVVEKIKQF